MRTVNVIEGIFFAALEKKEPGERAAYLDQACKGDAELRRCVERMLDAQPKVGDFLQPPAPKPAETIEPPPIEERPGTIIGPYKLLQQLGEGGFGVVFMAEQEVPVRRKVALKIIKPGMDSKQVVARFEAERQALALMDHPNIARVIDGGATDSGRPFFVMELVKGIPITEFCDQNRLTPRERLELFVPVCNAVQHAHQKGVIHRDIKPSNVLIAMYDDKPVPKVIDFGVAKAIAEPLTTHTLFTRVGQVIGTLEYMSPEQATFNALDVDTRADVYSLGVLLYELLTGTTPLDKEQLAKVGFIEMLRQVREVDPPKPSTRLSQSGDALSAHAVNRRSDSQKLPKLIKGELDWIAMKALEKDRTRRYETANALAADVQRYLKDELVEARPPSMWYRFGKYARRRKGELVAAALVLAVLLCGIAGTSLGMFAAGHARDKLADALTKTNKAYDDVNKINEKLDDTNKKNEDLIDELRDWQKRMRKSLYVSNINHAMTAYKEGRITRVLQFLDDTTPRKGEDDFRGWEWDYLNNLIHRGVAMPGKEIPGGGGPGILTPSYQPPKEDGVIREIIGDMGTTQASLCVTKNQFSVHLVDSKTQKLIARVPKDGWLPFSEDRNPGDFAFTPEGDYVGAVVTYPLEKDQPLRREVRLWKIDPAKGAEEIEVPRKTDVGLGYIQGGTMVIGPEGKWVAWDWTLDPGLDGGGPPRDFEHRFVQWNRADNTTKEVSVKGYECIWGPEALTCRSTTGIEFWDVKTGKQRFVAKGVELTYLENAILTMHEKKLLAYNLETGKLRWQADYQPFLFKGFLAKPAVMQPRDTMLVVRDSKHVTAFHMKDGKRLWQTLYEADLCRTLHVDAEFMILWTPDYLTALELAKGTVLWDEPFAAKVMLKEENRILGWDGTELVALDLAAEKKVWRVRFAEKDDIGADGRLMLSPNVQSAASWNGRDLTVCRLSDGKVIFKTTLTHPKDVSLEGVSDVGTRALFSESNRFTIVEKTTAKSIMLPAKREFSLSHPYGWIRSKTRASNFTPPPFGKASNERPGFPVDGEPFGGPFGGKGKKKGSKGSPLIQKSILSDDGKTVRFTASGAPFGEGREINVADDPERQVLARVGKPGGGPTPAPELRVGFVNDSIFLRSFSDYVAQVKGPLQIGDQDKEGLVKIPPPPNCEFTSAYFSAEHKRVLANYAPVSKSKGVVNNDVKWAFYDLDGIKLQDGIGLAAPAGVSPVFGGGKGGRIKLKQQFWVRRFEGEFLNQPFLNFGNQYASAIEIRRIDKKEALLARKAAPGWVLFPRFVKDQLILSEYELGPADQGPDRIVTSPRVKVQVFHAETGQALKEAFSITRLPDLPLLNTVVRTGMHTEGLAYWTKAGYEFWSGLPEAGAQEYFIKVPATPQAARPALRVSPDKKRLFVVYQTSDSMGVWTGNAADGKNENTVVLKTGHLPLPKTPKGFGPGGGAPFGIGGFGGFGGASLEELERMGVALPPSFRQLAPLSFVFSPDQKSVFLSYRTSDGLALWHGNAADGTTKQILTLPNADAEYPTQMFGLATQPLWIMQFSPKGDLLATASQTEVQVWNLTTGKLLHRLRRHDGRVNAVEFSPDASRLFVGEGREALGGGGFPGGGGKKGFGGGPFGSAEPSTGTPDLRVRVWDLATERELMVISLPDVQSFSGRLLGETGTVSAFSLRDGRFQFLESPGILRVLDGSKK